MPLVQTNSIVFKIGMTMVSELPDDDRRRDDLQGDIPRHQHRIVQLNIYYKMSDIITHPVTLQLQTRNHTYCSNDNITASITCVKRQTNVTFWCREQLLGQ
jgi:hypothetical protein